MFDLLFALLPIFLFFLLGYLLKYLNLVNPDFGQSLLKVVFYANMPAVIIIAITNLELTQNLFFLPLIAIFVHLILGVTSFILVKIKEYENTKAGVVVVGSLIMSTSFVVPFALIFYEELGVGLLLLFDLGNTIMALSLAYFFAVYYGSGEIDLREVTIIFLKKLFYAPPILALILSLIMNLSNSELPPLIIFPLNVLKILFTPFIMIALGLLFVPKIEEFELFSLAVLLRSVGGFILSFIGVLIFNLTGISKIIVLIGGSAPVGFVTVAFASLEKLDVKLAANIASLSAGLGLIFVPILFYVL